MKLSHLLGAVFLVLGVLFAQPARGQSISESTNCVELLANGDFERDDSWVLGKTERQPSYAADYVHTGARGVRLGIPPTLPNVHSYSSARQYVVIPLDAQVLTLRWWQWAGTEEGVLAAPGTVGDRQEALLLSAAGDPIEFLQRIRSNEQAWHEVAITRNAAAYRGMALSVYINAYNDGMGGRTWLYVDDVHLISCSAAVPATPSPPATLVPTATPEPTMMPAATPTATVAPVWFDCSYDAYNCSDFDTHSEAQAAFDYCYVRGYGDIYRLDENNDLIACEALPWP